MSLIHALNLVTVKGKNKALEKYFKWSVHSMYKSPRYKAL